jgi:hypothetical protein
METNNTKQSFTSFLMEKHFEENPELLDDMLPDAFTEWLQELDAEEMIKYAYEWGKPEKKEEYIIRKTSPKKGLPNGNWVCWHRQKEHLQSFGNTPSKALENYQNKFNNK